MTKPRILISEPNAPGEMFIPYVWGILKSYWEHHGSDAMAFDWLDPVFDRETARNGLDKHCAGPVDIVGLSCYTWNWDLNCKVGRWAKEQNPNCLVVAGGPEPDYKDPDFFRKHSYIDIIVEKDGEIPFMRILQAVLEGKRDFRHIPGLYLPSPATALRLLEASPIAHLHTGAAEVPMVFDYSPYLEHAALYERIMAPQRSSNRWTFAILETNRGCPYSCSYCDWGSSTMSKVRKFELTRVNAEIEWFAKMGVTFLFLADANFGILPRDVEITDRLVEARAKYGYPRKVYYSSAKNNPDRTVEIARRTHAAGLTPEHVLAVQHTDNEVLQAASRSNISAAKYREVVKKLADSAIPCEVQLILGMPGDTPEKWKNCLAELMEWGVHDNFQVSPYALLPNAPAADPEYMRKWHLETVERALIPYGGIKMKDSQLDCTKSKIVVGWRGFTRQDWVEVSTYTAFVRAYHNRALTRCVAMYLWFVYGVPYREFYDAVIDDFARQTDWMACLYRRVEKLYEDLLSNPDMTDEIELEDFPTCPFLVDSNKWLHVKTCLRLDDFYRDLFRFLQLRFPRAKCLKSIIDYQRNMVVTPDYSWRAGKSFPIDRDWPSFFDTVSKLKEYHIMEEPTGFYLPRIAEVAEDDFLGSSRTRDFGDGPLSQRWQRWLLQILNQQNTKQSSNYPDPRIKMRISFSARRPSKSTANP